MSAKSESAETRPESVQPEVKLKDVVQQMRDDGAEFFLNSTNVPTIMIAHDGFQQDWPASHQRVQDYIITLYYDLSDGQTLRSADLQLLMALIREECRNGGRRLSQAEEEATNDDVIVQRLLRYMSANEKFDGRTWELLSELKSLQRDRLPYSSELPAFLNVFSRRLRRRIPTLRGFHVGVVLEHKEAGSFCTLTRLPEFQPDGETDGAGNQSSAGSARRGTDLPPDDDADGQFLSKHPQAKATAAEKGGAA